ncbi:NUDIX hydrolase [Kaarinaea lacus]
MHRAQLLSLLDNYRTAFNTEAGYVNRIRRFVRQHENCFDRKQWPGHITGSAWVINPARDKVLLLHHRKHDQWFQPGGHADGDADILRVALRETQEETGLPPEAIKLVSLNIFDVDIHTIPASERGPEHMHYDIRFLVEIDDSIPVPGNTESHEVLWVPLEEVTRFNNNLSTCRMLEKSRRMRTAA